MFQNGGPDVKALASPSGPKEVFSLSHDVVIRLTLGVSNAPTAMSDTAKEQIQALIERETLGWNTRNPDLFLDMIHPDMIWPWPPKPRDHDPAQWKFVLGRFNTERWRQYLEAIFANFDLVHNHRNVVKIEISEEKDAAFAVVDVDSLWRAKDTKQDIHWMGRVCKMYTRAPNGEWKLISQTGPLDYELCRH